MIATRTRHRLFLDAETAADLMTANPVSLREDASLHEALVLFTKKGISAAPVIDSAGRPVGVISRSDIIIHDRTEIEWGAEARGRNEGKAAVMYTITVADVMTPAVFSVSPDACAARVIQQFSALNVHRLFVVDEAGVLVGVISASDVVRRLNT